MTRRAALIACLLTLAACKSGSARLEGKWRGVRADGVSVEAQAAANDYATKMEILAKGDSLTVVAPGSRKTGNYKVLKEDSEQLVIATDKTLSGSEKETFTFLDASTMRWSVAEGRTITFTKQKK
ncbi:MAG: hypothetical protein JNL38_05465 [Myxococcales bacterium]|jgi:hypothetical protein|nr:hypothetical protein [Myxococcales bacterium]